VVLLLIVMAMSTLLMVLTIEFERLRLSLVTPINLSACASMSFHNDVINTGATTTVAGSGRAAFADGAGTAASFNYPRGVALDVNGNLYVSDWYVVCVLSFFVTSIFLSHKTHRGNNRIRVINAQGEVSTLAGSGGTGHDDGVGLTASFDSPTGIAIDHTGSCLYVSDSNSHRIRRVTFSGEVITVAGQGEGGKLENGPGDVACFNQPTGITVDPLDGSVYVADFQNAAIRRITFHSKYGEGPSLSSCILILLDVSLI
jgi:DNA-binding beta-propeller fold protein YncE